MFMMVLQLCQLKHVVVFIRGKFLFQSAQFRFNRRDIFLHIFLRGREQSFVSLPSYGSLWAIDRFCLLWHRKRWQKQRQFDAIILHGHATADNVQNVVISSLFSLSLVPFPSFGVRPANSILFSFESSHRMDLDPLQFVRIIRQLTLVVQLAHGAFAAAAGNDQMSANIPETRNIH